MISHSVRLASLSLCLVGSLLSPALLAQQEEATEAAPIATQDGHRITIQFDEVVGTPLADFVELAKVTTGAPIECNQHDLKGIRLRGHGPKTIDADDFWPYFQAVLRAHELLIVPFGNVAAPGRPLAGPNTGFFSVRRTQGGAAGTRPGYIKTQAQVVSPDQLDQYRYDAGVVLTTTFVLDHVLAQEAVNMLQSYFTDPMLESVRAVTHSNSLVTTGFANSLCQIKQLIAQIDTPPTGTEPQFERIVMANADALEVMPIISTLLDLGPRQQRGPGAGGYPFPQETTRISADPRTNSLLVMAPAAELNRIAQLAARLDVSVTTSRQVNVVRLDHATARELAQTLYEWVHAAGMQGSVSIVAEPRTNSLIITAPGSHLQQVLKLIKTLDVELAAAEEAGAVKEG